MEIFVKEYLNEQEIKTVEGLAQHIIELKRNTIVPDIVFELADVLVNDKDCLLSFFGENNKVDTVSNRDFVGYQWINPDYYKYVPSTPQMEKLKPIRIDEDKIFKEWGMTCKQHLEWLKSVEKNANNKSRQEKVKKVLDDTVGKKESQTVEKAPIFTYCKVNKNAIEALSLRALHGHIKYEKPNDWENFTRVPNADFEYSNSQFRHALDIGEEDEETHLIASAWNAVARLELYLRNKVK